MPPHERAARDGDGEAQRLVHAPSASASWRPLDGQREPDGGQRAAEAAQQLVVAPAAAQRGADPGRVDLEDRARVVAELAGQAEIEDHAVAHARRQQLDHRGELRARLAGQPVQHLRAAAQQRHARDPLVQAQAAHLALQADEVARDQLVQDRVAIVARRRPRRRAGAARSRPSPGRSGSRAARSASSARDRTSSASAVPCGRRRADQLDAGLAELAHLPAVRAHLAVGVGDVAEAQRQARRRGSASRRRARSALSCRCAARARCRGRRAPGRPAASPRRARARTRTRARAWRPRRSRRRRRRRAARSRWRAARASRRAGRRGSRWGSGGSSRPRNVWGWSLS